MDTGDYEASSLRGRFAIPAHSRTKNPKMSDIFGIILALAFTEATACESLRADRVGQRRSNLGALSKRKKLGILTWRTGVNSLRFGPVNWATICSYCGRFDQVQPLTLNSPLLALATAAEAPQLLQRRPGSPGPISGLPVVPFGLGGQTMELLRDWASAGSSPATRPRLTRPELGDCPRSAALHVVPAGAAAGGPTEGSATSKNMKPNAGRMRG